MVDCGVRYIAHGLSVLQVDSVMTLLQRQHGRSTQHSEGNLRENTTLLGTSAVTAVETKKSVAHIFVVIYVDAAAVAIVVLQLDPVQTMLPSPMKASAIR